MIFAKAGSLPEALNGKSQKVLGSVILFKGTEVFFLLAFAALESSLDLILCCIKACISIDRANSSFVSS